MSNYKPTIGIEVHVELKTFDKVFSKAPNNTTAPVNSLVNIIDLAYPGVLPSVNKNVVSFGIKTCLALHCDVTRRMHFDRKNYFYPDLPKGYQITQLATPIGTNGYLTLNDEKKVRIHELHIEEDTCKSLHQKDRTLLNYNRAGVPLIEIVSCPDMHDGDEAMLYLERLRELLFYIGVSDCKMQEGSMRADVNVSISDSDVLGTRVEIKNIGSIHDVKDAIEAEVARQEEMLRNGENVTEETRKYDADSKTTILMRKKEVGNDYRYFPEPDIPYLVVNDNDIEKVKNSFDLLPDERRSIYLSRGILPVNVEKIIKHKDISDYLNQFVDTDLDFKTASNLLLGDISSYLNKELIEFNDLKLDKNRFKNLVDMIVNGDISSKILKDILVDFLTTDLDIKDILKNNGISLNNNQDELLTIINNVLDKFPDSIQDYKNGKDKAFQFLVGMVMKETRGSANPKLVSSMLKDLLDKLQD